MIQLPTQKIAPVRANPKRMVIYSKPKAGNIQQYLLYLCYMKVYNTENYIKAKKEYLNTDKTLREICKIYNLDRFTFSKSC